MIFAVLVFLNRFFSDCQGHHPQGGEVGEQEEQGVDDQRTRGVAV